MNKKSFFLVAGIAVLAAIVAYLVAGERAPQTTVAGDAALIPGLTDRLNDVSRIVVTGAGGEAKVTLERGESAWTVAERGGYPARTAKIRTFLIDIADARLVERKTARAENYPALGVEDVASEDATGVEVALEGAGDGARFIIGKSTRGSGAVYVRRSDDEAAWVADKRLRVDQKPTDWLVKDLVDINAARVQRVTITHPDGEVVDAVRGEANFEVAELPDGKTLSSPTVANAFASVLDDLKFEDVVPVAEFDPGDAEPVGVRFETSDGLVVESTATAANNQYYLQLATSAQPADPASLGASDESADEVTSDVKVATMLEGIKNQSAEINERVSGWVFTIPLYKYEQLTKKKADLVSDEE